MDPVFEDEDSKCVYWYGDVTKDDEQAVIRTGKPGDTVESRRKFQEPGDEHR